MDKFIMRKFIDQGYNKSVLEVLNDIWIHMKDIFLSDVRKSGNKMAK